MLLSRRRWRLVPIAFFAGAKPLVSFLFGSPVPREGGVSESCSRDARYLVISYPIYQFLESVSGFAGACHFGVMCWQHFSNRLPWVSCCPGRKALSCQLSGTMFAMASSENHFTSRRSLTLLQMRRTRSESGSSLRTILDCPLDRQEPPVPSPPCS